MLGNSLHLPRLFVKLVSHEIADHFGGGRPGEDGFGELSLIW